MSETITAGGSGGAIIWDLTVTTEHDSIWPAETSGNSSTTVTVQLVPVIQGFESNVSLEAIRIGTTGGHDTSGTCHPSSLPAGVGGSLASSGGSIGYSTNGQFQTQFSAGTAAGRKSSTST